MFIAAALDAGVPLETCGKAGSHAIPGPPCARASLDRHATHHARIVAAARNTSSWSRAAETSVRRIHPNTRRRAAQCQRSPFATFIDYRIKY
jgi:hypothetical protein